MMRDVISGLAFQFRGQDLEQMLNDGHSDSEGEQKLVETLVRVSEIYLTCDGDVELWSRGLFAAARAIIVLDALGLAKMVHGCHGANWTDDGRPLLRGSA